MKENFDIIINDEITSLLIEAGISANNKGYNYLKEGIKIALKQPESLNSITKILYPSIAEKFNTTPQLVERNLRHCITKAYDNNTLFNIKELNPNYCGNYCNSNVIALFSQIIDKRLHKDMVKYQNASIVSTQKKIISDLQERLAIYERTYKDYK